MEHSFNVSNESCPCAQEKITMFGTSSKWTYLYDDLPTLASRIPTSSPSACTPRIAQFFVSGTYPSKSHVVAQYAESLHEIRLRSASGSESHPHGPTDNVLWQPSLSANGSAGSKHLRLGTQSIPSPDPYLVRSLTICQVL